jgi:hypothetical protein
MVVPLLFFILLEFYFITELENKSKLESMIDITNLSCQSSYDL